MAKFRLTPLDELVDEVWGVKGTPKRDEMEVRLKEEIETSNIDIWNKSCTFADDTNKQEMLRYYAQSYI